MNTVVCNKHKTRDKDWPFLFEQNIGVVTTLFVMNGEQPIVEVLHWHEGDWQFMCNTTEDANDGMLVCFGCLYERFPWISQFKNLKKGYLAYFDNDKQKWITEEFEET